MDNQELQRLKNKYDIIGNDPVLNRALETAVAVAPTDLTVLITGESGVGKENIPKIIQQSSRRKNGKYFAVNCGAIPEGTIDSELFGHEKGSFTGAIETRKGYFEVADGGTLFLDEVGELPMASQAKLLRVLQSGEFIKVGSSKVEKTDVRVVAATNVNLWYAVGQGRFREDLYYRLNAIQITMPALRDRKDDIYLLFRKFTSDFSEKYGMKKIILTHDAIEKLRDYRWPGNIRQLKNFTETVTAIESQKGSYDSERCEIDSSILGQYFPKEDQNLLPAKASAGGSDNMTASEKQMIIKALLDLKRDVDKIKADLYKERTAVSHMAPSIEGPRNMPEEQAEWQVQKPRENVLESESNGKLYDIQVSKSEPEEQIFQEEDLSLQKNGEDLIKKALDKYQGNRKLAAKELGISERTLYRKLPDEYKNMKPHSKF
ncbi:MAG: sigma-54 dependent transcriptional regulator [Bacteroidales bacterium]|jgi:transcriptional regulator with PAS, ATPase and Fis domain|nr:sigma-54 dependent transcriptional regulator [Bacteroidales bacterium]MCI1784880.1 sigma-54 dependent transcriptional regulator [Bacteroidales bacterium]